MITYSISGAEFHSPWSCTFIRRDDASIADLFEENIFRFTSRVRSSDLMMSSFSIARISISFGACLYATFADRLLSSRRGSWIFREIKNAVFALFSQSISSIQYTPSTDHDTRNV